MIFLGFQIVKRKQVKMSLVKHSARIMQKLLMATKNILLRCSFLTDNQRLNVQGCMYVCI